MTRTRRNTEGLLARVNFPLYTLQLLTSRHVLVAGGGGSAKTGVANGFEVFEIAHDGKKFLAQEVIRHETGPKVVMNTAAHSTSRHTYLVAGQESHCQLYRVEISVEKNDDEHKIPNGKKEDNNVRHRKNNATEKNNAKEDNGPVKRLRFNFIADDSVQTDFSESEPVQRVVRISRCGKLMATGGTDGHIRLWAFPSMAPVHDFDGHSKELDDIDFSPDSKSIVSVAKDGKGLVWKTRGGETAFELKGHGGGECKYVFKRCRYGPVEEDKRKTRIFTISNALGASSQKANGVLAQWEGETGVLRRSVAIPESLSALAVRDDGRFVAVGTMFTGSVQIYIAFSLQCALKVEGAHSMFVTGLELLPAAGSAISSTSEAAAISISVDNRICIHSLPYRHTIPPWMAIVLIVLTLFLTFVFCSYIGL